MRIEARMEKKCSMLNLFYMDNQAEIQAFKLEMVAFTLSDCEQIQAAGGDRIELCDHQPAGGTTPSYGMIQQARLLTQIELTVMIRPRGGDFVYSKQEVAAMRSDIQCCKQLGCDGVVLGVLDLNHQVDQPLLSTLVELAYPLEVTFHRAFDRIANQQEALEAIVRAGCTRILSSGGADSAMQGADQLKALVDQAEGRIEILVGGGVRAHNLSALMWHTGARSYHSADIPGTAEMKKILSQHEG